MLQWLLEEKDLKVIKDDDELDADELKAQVGGKVLEVECAPLMKASSVFQHLAGVIGVTAYGTTIHLNTAGDSDVGKELNEIAKKENIRVVSVKEVPASLEDVFATLEAAKHEGD